MERGEDGGESWIEARTMSVSVIGVGYGSKSLLSSGIPNLGQIKVECRSNVDRM